MTKLVIRNYFFCQSRKIFYKFIDRIFAFEHSPGQRYRWTLEMNKLSLVFFIFLFTWAHADEANLNRRPKLHICTIASEDIPQLQQLLHSCRQHNLSIEVLGLNQPYPGNGIKLIRTLKYLEKSHFPDDDLLLFVDAYDVLILADEKTIVDKFLKMQVPFVISVEKTMHRDQELKDLIPLSPTPFRFINAGSYMGYVGHVKKWLRDLRPIKKAFSDQRHIVRHSTKHPEMYAFDYYCQLFIALAFVKSDEIKIDEENGVVHCLITGSTPCVIHGPGAYGKKKYQEIYDKLFIKGP